MTDSGRSPGPVCLAAKAAQERARLRDYQVFVTDDRYTVPTLHLIQAPNPAMAGELAERILAESPHHLSVEVFDDDLRVFASGPEPHDPEPKRPPDGVTA